MNRTLIHLFGSLAFRNVLTTFALTAVWLGLVLHGQFASGQETPTILRIGIIGLDTSHSTAFTEMLNAEKPSNEFVGCRVVAAYPYGSADIKSSTERIPEYTEKVKKLGVEIVDSIDLLLTKVDCVLLETNDGRPHLEQFRKCIAAGKPTFIDKPVAASLHDAIAIFQEAADAKVPVFTSSSLRFAKSTLAAREGKLGKIKHCATSSPAHAEATHPLLYWYGIHGVESLFTIMGTGCESVTCVREDGKIVVRGKWSDGRTGEFREGSGYSGKLLTDTGEHDVGSFDGYRVLLVEIVKFFRTQQVPVNAAESLEIYAFMSAAESSLKHDGIDVTLASVMKQASAKEAVR